MARSRHELTYWDMNAPFIIGISVGIVFAILFTLAIFASIDKIEKWDKFLETSTCQEIDTYLLEHVKDIGVGSGLSDLRADKYAQIEKLQELRCI